MGSNPAGLYQGRNERTSCAPGQGRPVEWIDQQLWKSFQPCHENGWTGGVYLAIPDDGNYLDVGTWRIQTAAFNPTVLHLQKKIFRSLMRHHYGPALEIEQPK